MKELNTPVSWKWHAVTLVLIIAAGIVAYSNSIHGSFHYDDLQTITWNRSIRNLNPAKIWRDNNHFRFIGFYSFALNEHFGGLNNVKRWHYVNISLHIICSLFLYWVLSFIIQYAHSPGSKIPLVASLLFAVHPLCSEPVNYIQARHIFFYSLFSLSGVLGAAFLIKARSLREKIISVLGMAMSMVLGGLSKEVGLFYVPAGILLFFITFREREKKNKSFSRFGIACGIGLAVIILAIITNWLKPLSTLFSPLYNPVTKEKFTFVSYLLTEAQVFWRYISLLVPLSFRLNVDHYVRMVGIETLGQRLMAVIPLLGIGAILILAFKKKAKDPVFFFLLWWSILGVLPYLLIPRSAELMVEYKVYLSAMGLMGLLAWGFERSVNFVARGRLSLHRNIVLGIILSLLVIFCIKETRMRNQVWKTEFTLWNDAVKKSPNKERVHNCLGLAYISIGKNEKALASFKRAIEISPHYAKAYSNLGNMYNLKGNYNKAIASVKKAIEIDPNSFEAYNNLGVAYQAKGMHGEAIIQYKKAIKINSWYPEIYNNLGKVYYAQRLYDKAVIKFKKVIEIDPGYTEAYNNLAAAYNNRGLLYYTRRLYNEAVIQYQKAIQINPDYPEAYNNLAAAYGAQGKHNEAINYGKKAIQINPDYSEAYYNLSAAYYYNQEYKLAIECYDKARVLGGKPKPNLARVLKPYR